MFTLFAELQVSSVKSSINENIDFSFTCLTYLSYKFKFCSTLSVTEVFKTVNTGK